MSDARSELSVGHHHGNISKWLSATTAHQYINCQIIHAVHVIFLMTHVFSYFKLPAIKPKVTSFRELFRGRVYLEGDYFAATTKVPTWYTSSLVLCPSKESTKL